VFTLFGVGSSGSNAAQYQSLLSRVSPSLATLGELIGLRFGAYIFVGVVASVGCLYLLSLWWKRVTAMTELFYPSIFVAFFMFMLVSLLLFFFGPRRIMGYVGMIGIIVIVIALDRLKIAQLIQKRPWSVTIGLSLSIALLLTLSIIAVYPSPEYTQAQNQIVTEQQIKGSEWLFAHNQNRTVNSYAHPLDRLYDYQHIGRSSTSYIKGPPPDHFNYSGLNDSRAAVISKKSREFYPTVYPEFREFWAFYDSDLQRLRSSADHVYANGDNDIYVISKKYD
jgi:hypothetical protein